MNFIFQQSQVENKKYREANVNTTPLLYNSLLLEYPGINDLVLFAVESQLL